MNLRTTFSEWEKAVAKFGVSPWSTVALLAYAVVWIAAEALRGKWIGWDGAITIVLGEVALASLRAISRREIETEGGTE